MESDLRSRRGDPRGARREAILARQMPGSAKGVMFVTLEDESVNAKPQCYISRSSRPMT
jgi:hypothetical protein